MTVTCWWTCPICQDRMAQSEDPRRVEHDRDEHLKRHGGQTVEPRLLRLSSWPRA